MSAAAERPEVDHASKAADHVLALVAAHDPTYEVTAEERARLVELIQSIARFMAVGANSQR